MSIEREVNTAWLANLRHWAIELVRVTADSRKRAMPFDPALVALVAEVEFAAQKLARYIDSRREGKK